MDSRALDEARIEAGHLFEEEAFDPDIAGIDRAEAADIAGRIDADILVADAPAEGVGGRGGRIVGGPLRRERGAGAEAEQDEQGKTPQPLAANDAAIIRATRKLFDLVILGPTGPGS